MRKLAILGLILLIIIVVFTTMAVFNVMAIRDITYQAIEGTVLQPGHDWIVSTWISIGSLGFTYIFAAGLGIAIGGGLFMVFIIYGLFWKKGIEQHLLHRSKQQQPAGLSSLQLQRAPAEPEAAPPPQKKLEEPVQTEA